MSSRGCPQAFRDFRTGTVPVGDAVSPCDHEVGRMSSGWGQSPLRINFSVSGRGQSPLRIRLPEVSQFLQGTWLRVLTGFRWGHSPLQINFRAGTVPAVDAVRPFNRDSSRRCFGISGRGQSPPRIHFQDGDSPGCESRLRIPVANQSRLESISGWGQSRRSMRLGHVLARLPAGVSGFQGGDSPGCWGVA